MMNKVSKLGKKSMVLFLFFWGPRVRPLRTSKGTRRPTKTRVCEADAHTRPLSDRRACFSLMADNVGMERSRGTKEEREKQSEGGGWKNAQIPVFVSATESQVLS